MRLLYTIGIYLYTLGVRIAALFSEKPRQMVCGWRKSWQTMWQLSHDSGAQPVAWFHAASLGEFEQARPVLERFRVAHPDYKILLTFFSPSGYEVRKNYDGADAVCYLPMDTAANARRLVQTVAPRVAFFVKYDFWFNYLGALRGIGCRTYLFSAIFRPSQYFFKWYGSWFCRQLSLCYSHLFVQNDVSLRLLQGHGVEHCSIAGDTRFDRVHQIALDAKHFAAVDRYVAINAGRQIVVAGSSWEPDEQRLHTFLATSQRPPLLILAPHVIAPAHLDAIERLFGGERCVRYSQIDDRSDDMLRNKILIIDNIGMLSSLYGYATVAYIGGGWGVGIHNTLEAVAHGKPVVFGPRYAKFQEAHDLIARKAGFTYSSDQELLDILSSLLDDAQHLQRASQSCIDYMNLNLGSTEKILSMVEQQLAKA